MIINIRGTNGSGKSTVVRALMALGAFKPLYGVLGPRRPEAYQLSIGDITAPIYVLGPYQVETGGCDAVHPFDIILDLLAKYSSRGHIVFEGSLVSDHYGRVGDYLAKSGNALLAFMPFSLEECLARVEKRRSGRGNSRVFNPKNTTSRYESIQKLRQKVEQEGIIRTVTLSTTGAANQIVEELRR